MGRSLLYDQFDHLSLYSLRDPVKQPVMIEVEVNGQPIAMEVDSGSYNTLIGHSMYKNYFNDSPLQESKVMLNTWGEEVADKKKLLHTSGWFTAAVKYNGREAKLPMLVMQRDGPPLPGRAWFEQLGIGIYGINKLGVGLPPQFPPQLEGLEPLFGPDMGEYNGPPAHIYMKDGAQPVFLPARSLPIAAKDGVVKEIDRMVSMNVYEPVPYSQWATPTCNVLKRDGSYRLVGDYKVTINPNCKREIYPMSTVEEVITQLAGGKYFTKIDLSSAFLQIPVDEETSNLLTLNTHKGLFRVRRLCPGLSSAPAVFMRVISSVLGGMEGVVVYMDDVLIQAADLPTMWDRVRAVMQRLLDRGFRLRLDKCLFAVTELDFVGYHISGAGISPTDEKVQVLMETPSPKNKPELASLLGYINYYERFFPDRASKFRPLYNLLQEGDGEDIEWTPEAEACFQYIKEVMSSKMVLVHYDARLPLVMACDASPYGVGAVLSHVIDNEERPIWNASKTLHGAELNYSQLDKEALAIMFGIKKFHKLVYGRPFTIITDHKPLLGIFAPDRRTPEVLSPRMLR